MNGRALASRLESLNSTFSPVKTNELLGRIWAEKIRFRPTGRVKMERQIIEVNCPRQ
jgi:hypothetical protein